MLRPENLFQVLWVDDLELKHIQQDIVGFGFENGSKKYDSFVIFTKRSNFDKMYPYASDTLE